MVYKVVFHVFCSAVVLFIQIFVLVIFLFILDLGYFYLHFEMILIVDLLVISCLIMLVEFFFLVLIKLILFYYFLYYYFMIHFVQNFRLRTADGSAGTPFCSGSGVSGSGSGGQCPQQPQLHGGEESRERCGWHDSLSCGGSGEQQYQRAVDIGMRR